ncbi:MAG: hypothetical protein Q7R92_04265 [bacterium]|nr:hypothetical protein [bacterium]
MLVEVAYVPPAGLTRQVLSNCADTLSAKETDSQLSAIGQTMATAVPTVRTMVKIACQDLIFAFLKKIKFLPRQLRIFFAAAPISRDRLEDFLKRPIIR